MGERCVTCFKPLPTNQSVVVFGTIFMRSYYTVFDFDNARIGLAQAYP
jgi:hypothetical protein